MSIQVALAEDHSLVRQSLAAALREEEDLEVALEVGTARELMERLDMVPVDVLLLDITLPDRNGIDVAKDLKRRHPGLRIIALTAHGERSFVEEMLKAGAQGYVVKTSSSQELVTAIRTVARGKRFLCAEANDTLLQGYDPSRGPDLPPVSVLTPREREVLILLVQGCRSGDIADKLAISVETVNVHRRNIREKTGIHSIAELTHYAIREGLARS